MLQIAEGHLGAVLRVAAATAVVLLVTAAPAAARGSEIDPDGQPVAASAAGPDVSEPELPFEALGPVTPRVGSMIDPRG